MRRFIAANRERLRGDDYAALYDWSIESPAEFWAAVWQFCGVASRHAIRHRRCATRTRMPGAQVVRRRAAELRREPARARRERHGDRVRATSAASASSSPGTSCARRSRASRRACARSASAAATASRRSSRIVPRPWSRCSRRRASAPCGRRARRTSASTPCSTASGKSRRRCCSRPTATSTTARASTRCRRVRAVAARLPELAAVVIVPYRERRSPTSRAAERARCSASCSLDARRAPLRARRVRRSALHSLFVGHDGRAEVHRARRRRHAAAAPQGARAAHGHPPRRRRVLLHDLRLDDVELARVGARVAARRSCSTTAPRSTPIPASCGGSPSASASPSSARARNI